MGDLVSCRCKSDASPLAACKTCSPPSVGNVTGHLLSGTSTHRPRDRTIIARGTPDLAVPAEPDPYILVLLADQELHSGRDEQAQAFLIRAYATFDRQATSAHEKVAHAS